MSRSRWEYVGVVGSSWKTLGVELGSKLGELESLGVDGSRLETMGDIGRHTQTAGVRKGWSSRESLGVAGRHWKTLGVVDVVVVYSPTNHLAISPAARQR